MTLDPCGAAASPGGTVSRRMLRDMCLCGPDSVTCVSVAIPPAIAHSRTSRVPGTGRSGPGDICAGGVKGRAGGKAFDQMAGELKA
jgi:hypothetical protein